MDQNNGGIIGKINTPTTSVASGVWSLDSQFESQSGSTWPLAFPQTTFSNSVRMNGDQDDDSLSKSISGVNITKFTLSFWTKYAAVQGIGSEGPIIFSSENNSSDYITFQFNTANQVDFSFQGTQNRRITNRVFRDPSAYYHFLVVIDTTQSTASDRLKIYVNGSQETSFATSTTNVSQDANISPIDETLNYSIGRYNSQSSDFCYDGYLAEFIAVYGQALTPTSFGATNPVTNIWEPIAYAGTYGSNGFKLNFSDASNLGDDTSGNGNDFTVNNLTSIDQSTDTPSNNFATMNPLNLGATTGGEFLNGNLDVHMGGTAKGVYYSTIGVSTGKWYVEVNPDSGSGGNSYIGVSGNTNDGGRGANDYLGARSNDYGYYQSDGKVYSSGTGATYGNTYSNGNIIGVYLDLDNNKLYFSINGTLQNSGTGVSITDPASTQQGAYFFCVGDDNAYAERRFNLNFGSPIESISSGNTDGEFGNFEYSTTITGDGASKTFKALCTKNLAEYG